MRPADARSLRGRVVFCAAQAFGKCGAVPLRALRNLSEVGRMGLRLGAWERAALAWLVEYLRTAPPREIAAKAPAPVVLFTDGACEPGPAGEPVVTIGAVVFPEGHRQPRYFGTTVPKGVCDLWKVGCQKQLVAQAELLPVVLAKTTWPELFKNRPNLTFIDNDAARFGLIKGYSPSLPSGRLIGASWLADTRLRTTSWFCRVASASNVADGPSRLDFEFMSAWPGSIRCEPCGAQSWGGSLWPGIMDALCNDSWKLWDYRVAA